MGDAAAVQVAGGKDHHPLTGDGPWLIGRSSEAHVALADDPHCSREQARIRRERSAYLLEPLSKTVPITVNGRPLDGAQRLADGDVIAFSRQRLTFRTALVPAATPAGERTLFSAAAPTVVDSMPTDLSIDIPASRGFTVGRSSGKDQVALDHPCVSRRHADVEVKAGRVSIRDLGSTNGTFVNGSRITGAVALSSGDTVDIGPYHLTFTGQAFVRESRSGNIRLVGQGLTRDVRAAGGGGLLRILNDASVIVQPREFIALIGPSGSGKTTLMNLLSGRTAPTAGRVTVNGVDLHGNFEALKQDIAMVPQHNVLHEPLTLRQALTYTAKLRLPVDQGADARDEIVERTAASVELGHRLDARIATLSGGQKKRASLASETLNRPSLLFLDEVTSGLDESTDGEIMSLLRRLSEDGMTIVCVTHTLANIEAFCHKVVVMASPGVVAFAGTPPEALTFFRIGRLGQVFGRLAEEGSDAWRDRYQAAPEFARNSRPPVPSGASESRQAKPARPAASPMRRLAEGVRQFAIVTHRNVRLLLADRRTLAMAAMQSLLIGLLLGYAFSDLGQGQTRVQSQTAMILLLGLSAFWLGCNGASKDIVADLPIYRQERDVNLSTMAFVLSKFLVSYVFIWLQLLLLFLVTALVADDIPGTPLVQFGLLSLGTAAGTGLGLLISASTDSRDQATTIVPLALVPQFILAGVIVPNLPALAQQLSEAVVSGYWIVESMRSAFIEADGPILVPNPATQILEPMAKAASSGIGALVVFLHALVGVASAYLLTLWRNGRGRVGR
jgi:ABC-type multidrug transport system ATPase subunit